MNTPIFDAVSRYASSFPLRLHMPGHKGIPILGTEARDVTEIHGMDVLYGGNGVICQSEDNAAGLFGSAATLYSTEGSTLSIRAMLYLAQLYAAERGLPFSVAAGRNAHKAFLTACALLDVEPTWLSTGTGEFLTSKITPSTLADFFQSCQTKPQAVYLTSPDYLGNVADLAELAEICHQNGAILLVDNAHGAYLHFLPDPAHPLDLGADLVCDSAHKTLPVITGGAYLHISKNAPRFFSENAARAMALFASSSPSYLILQSLDLCNAYLFSSFSQELNDFSARVWDLKKELKKQGFDLVGNEPLKITLRTKVFGYRGDELARKLESRGIYLEFYDPDHLVMMLTPQNGADCLARIREAFSKICRRDPILDFPPPIPKPSPLLSPRRALFSPTVSLPAEQCEGKILGSVCVSCPPAIPIAICGERITPEHVKAFLYYGISTLDVIP